MSIDKDLDDALAQVDQVEDQEIDQKDDQVTDQADDQTDDQAKGQSDDEPEYQIPDDLKANPAWKEEARQAWESLLANQEYHEQLKPLRDQFTSDYQYRTQLEQERQQLAQQAQVAQQFQQVSQQYGDLLQGRDPMQMAGQLFYAAKQLQTDPKNTLVRLAQQYGVDLNQLTDDQPYVDETTRQLQGQLEAMQQQFQQQQIAQQQAQQQQLMESARSFEFETDAEGKPLRPYVADVAKEMIGLMQSGYAQDFQTAYDRAIRLRDDVWEKVQKDQGKSGALQRSEQARRAKAAASAQPKRSKSSVTTPKGVEDLDDALDRALAEQAA